MNLSQLREELAHENSQLIQSISRRRQLVDKIQTIKLEQNKTLFDPEQEWKIFASIKDQLQQLHLVELLAFSMIAESQVRSHGDYPAWSESAHIVDSQNLVQEKINPILLSQVKPDLIDGLKFSENFLFIKDFIRQGLRGLE